MSKAVLIINDALHSIEYAAVHQFGSKVDVAAATATSAVITNHWFGKLSLLTSCSRLVLPFKITTWYTLLIAIPSATSMFDNIIESDTGHY